MTNKFYSKRNLSFLLNEVFQVKELTQMSHFQDHSEETFGMVLDTAAAFAETKLLPLLTEMDRKEPQLVNGKITIHPKMHDIIRQFGQGGWINAGFNYEEGGQQLPVTVLNTAAFIFQAANYSASVFPFLTTGAANLLLSFGSKALIETFTPKMYEGLWQGTMALTEPDAGSSLSDISTSAIPTETDGVYRIKGQKIYISAGDHDGCENVVHLMLAKIKGGPAGAKGISLFAVPQKRIKGTQLIDNDIVTAGVYHKMGYKGAPIAHLVTGSQDNCNGYLVGEPHKGLAYMFQMMNEARIGVGMNATAIGTAAYYASLAYAKERPQGRKISDKDPARPQVAIVQHADVKRMLLFQKAVLEGSLSLLTQCGIYADIAHASTDEAEKNKASLLLDLLTPVAKSYPSEMGCLTTSAAVQILGGAGYTTDFPVEQFYREARIHPIHEGTTGIHGLDLLGRKITLNNGAGFKAYIAEIEQVVQKSKEKKSLAKHAEKLENYLKKIQKITQHLLLKTNPEEMLADATLYLEAFGIMTIAWQWLKQGLVVPQADHNDDFYAGKMAALRYFFSYELVKIDALAIRLMDEDLVTVETQTGWLD